MLTRTAVTPDGQPLTHLGCIQACTQLASAGRPGVLPWVQVRKRFGGRQLVLCGQVIELDASSDTDEWFKVGTDLGPVWAVSRNVRLCSGDGRCTCEADAGSRNSSAVGKRCPAPSTATRCGTSRLEIRPARSISAA